MAWRIVSVDRECDYDYVVVVVTLVIQYLINCHHILYTV